MEITILIPYHFITFSTFCKTLIRLVSHRGFSSVNQKSEYSRTIPIMFLLLH